MRIGAGAPFLAIVPAVLAMAGAVEARPLRVLALDQCADQYVLALAPDADVRLSPRADDPDSWMRHAARGRARARPTLESAVLFEPDVVVRYWGGDARLLGRLERGGARIVSLDDATDFPGVEINIARMADAVGAASRGRALTARMHGRLEAAAPATARGGAQYVTSGGYTAGAGTMVDSILRAAGFRNLADAPGFAPIRLERIALAAPIRFVFGFFDQVRSDWRGVGRHPVVQRQARGRTAAHLPASVLTCPAWFAADAVQMLADDAG